MAELIPRDRLQPCLLDRLLDDEPGTRKENRDRRVVSLRQYRELVRRDLELLLNSRIPAAQEGLEAFDEVPASVLNYGLPDLCGLTASGVDPETIEQHVRQAIRSFEPRILQAGLSVRAVVDYDLMQRNAISVEIEGQLWAQPVPEHLFLRMEIDLETARFTSQDRSDG